MPVHWLVQMPATKHSTRNGWATLEDYPIQVYKGSFSSRMNRSSTMSSLNCTHSFQKLVAPHKIRWCIHSTLVWHTALRPSSGHADFRLGGENVIIRKTHLKSLLSWTTSGKTTLTPIPNSFHMMTHVIFFDTLLHKIHGVHGSQLPDWLLIPGIT